MQIKRDTGYALKILLTIAENLQHSEYEGTMSLKEITVSTGIPRQIAGRLCRVMSKSGFISIDSENGGSVSCSAEKRLLDVSLLDIIESVEGNSEIFAVIDKECELYRKYGKRLIITDERLAEEMRNLSVGKILDIKRN